MKKEKCYYWPYYFSLTLTKSEQRKIRTILPYLQQAQIFLWRALNIYDDFLDNEGNRAELIKANDYYRHFLQIHYSLGLSAEYYQKFEQLFLQLENVNLQEVNGRKILIKRGLLIIPKKIRPLISLKRLADKSAVLSLGASALLAYLGEPLNSARSQATFNFWRYFLSAKQLADDSYDWQEDLKNGTLTTANAPLLKALKVKTIPLNSLNNLNHLFGLYCAPIIIKNLKYFCRLAEKEINICNRNNAQIIKLKLLKPIKLSCRRAEKCLQTANL